MNFEKKISYGSFSAIPLYGYWNKLTASKFFFSKCNNEQEIYHEFTSKVEETAYQAAKNVLQHSYPKCSIEGAWTAGNLSVYEECTIEISESNARIKSTLPKIKEFAYFNNLNMSIQAQITQMMENVQLNPYINDGLEVAIAYIKQTVSNSQLKTCSELPECLESTRKVVV